MNAKKAKRLRQLVQLIEKSAQTPLEAGGLIVGKVTLKQGRYINVLTKKEASQVEQVTAINVPRSARGIYRNMKKGV